MFSSLSSRSWLSFWAFLKDSSSLRHTKRRDINTTRQTSTRHNMLWHNHCKTWRTTAQVPTSCYGRHDCAWCLRFNTRLTRAPDLDTPPPKHMRHIFTHHARTAHICPCVSRSLLAVASVTRDRCAAPRRSASAAAPFCCQPRQVSPSTPQSRAEGQGWNIRQRTVSGLMRRVKAGTRDARVG